MEFRGKLIGALAGALAFQLPGALVGLVLGHFLYDRKQLSPIDRMYKQMKEREWVFIQNAFAMCAKIAKAKGSVNAYEVKFMERMIKHQFKLSDDARKQAIQVWNDAKEHPKPFEEYALEFHRTFQHERHHIINMMDMLVGIAACDQSLHPAEERLLHKASSILHVSRMQFERIKERHIAPPKREKWTPLDPHYAILGATPQDDLKTIKRKYRDLAKKWHPDAFNAEKVSKEKLQHAAKKFQEITAAYEVICQRMIS
jgi:DnaJ like chaperone protein